MAEIIKEKSIIIRTVPYSDSSLIITFFGENRGKYRGIFKGAKKRKGNSASTELFNVVETIYYYRENREMYVISDMTLIKHHYVIRENLEALKYASGAAELVFELIPENEEHPMLFRGLERYYNVLNEMNQNAGVLFLKFLRFFIKEAGYDLQTGNCHICGKKMPDGKAVSINYDSGIICNECKSETVSFFSFRPELYDLFLCLSRKDNITSVQNDDIKTLINFFEKYLKYHIESFKGIRSIKIF